MDKSNDSNNTTDQEVDVEDIDQVITIREARHLLFNPKLPDTGYVCVSINNGTVTLPVLALLRKGIKRNGVKLGQGAVLEVKLDQYELRTLMREEALKEEYNNPVMPTEAFSKDLYIGEHARIFANELRRFFTPSECEEFGNELKKQLKDPAKKPKKPKPTEKKSCKKPKDEKPTSVT